MYLSALCSVWYSTLILPVSVEYLNKRCWTYSNGDVCADRKVLNDSTSQTRVLPGPGQSTLGGIKKAGCGVAQWSVCRRLALVLLQAYITSWWGQIRWEHSQAGHTHIHPDVGLGGACGRLLAEEEEVAWKELQLCLARLALQDNLQEWNEKVLQVSCVLFRNRTTVNQSFWTRVTRMCLFSCPHSCSSVHIVLTKQEKILFSYSLVIVYVLTWLHDGVQIKHQTLVGAGLL